MTDITHTSTVRLRDSVVVEVHANDEHAAKMIEEIVEQGRPYIDSEESLWLAEQATHGMIYFLVVFRHDRPVGIARAALISDLSNRNVHATISAA